MHERAIRERESGTAMRRIDKGLFLYSVVVAMALFDVLAVYSTMTATENPKLSPNAPSDAVSSACCDHTGSIWADVD